MNIWIIVWYTGHFTGLPACLDQVTVLVNDRDGIRPTRQYK